MEKQEVVQAPLNVAASSQPSILDTPKTEVVKKLPTDNNAKMKLFMVGVLVILAGVGTGYALSGASAKTGDVTPVSDVAKENSKDAAIDESAMSAPEQGILHEGGLEGEGTHYLDRGLGSEKYIYLLSTVLDLDSFIDKKVEVQGQTLGADKAGWLMDVVRIKEIN